MRVYDIIADSTCDLPGYFQEEYGIRVLPGHVTLPSGREILSMPCWEEMTGEEFYADLRKRPSEYTTSPTNVAEFAEAFRESLRAGRDVLCFVISGGISGAVRFAEEAAGQVRREFPEGEIRVIDTLRFGPGFGLMTVYAAEMRRQGKDLRETEQWILENRNRFHQAGWLDDLSFVAKKGRITHAKAFFGALAGVKPIGEFDYNGLTTVLCKAPGQKAAFGLLLTYIGKTIEKPEEQIIFIAQTGRRPQAEMYRKMIEETFHPKAVYVQDVHMSCGVNIGPGLMAAYYVGRPISPDLSEERKIVNDALA